MHQPFTGRRRTLAVSFTALALAATLLVPACSGSEESEPATDASEQSAGPSDGGQAPATTPPETVPPSTVPDDEFADIIDGLDAQFDAAGDSCALLTAINAAGSLPTPANPDQAKAATELLASLLRRLSENPPAGQEGGASALADAADGLIAEGEASGWNPDAIAGSAAISPAAQDAVNAFIEACALSAPGGTDGPPPGAPVG